MAPPPQQFRISNVLYTVPILTQQMDAINLEINNVQDELTSIRTQLLRKTEDLTFQQKQLLTLYILETCAFPDST